MHDTTVLNITETAWKANLQLSAGFSWLIFAIDRMAEPDVRFKLPRGRFLFSPGPVSEQPCRV